MKYERYLVALSWVALAWLAVASHYRNKNIRSAAYADGYACGRSETTERFVRAITNDATFCMSPMTFSCMSNVHIKLGDIYMIGDGPALQFSDVFGFYVEGITIHSEWKLGSIIP